jgi:hypothetical protein
MLTSAPLRLVAEDRPTFSPSQHLRTDSPARAWIRDRDTKTKKGKKDLHREIKKNNLLLMTVSVQIYENRKRVNKSEFQRKFKQFLTGISIVL